MEKDKVIANVFRDFSCWVGLDLSLTATGLSVLYQDIKLDGYRYTLTSPHKGPRRLSEFADHIKLAAEQILAYRPASEVLVCIENYAFSQFGKIVHLGELGGVVKQNLFDAGLSNILVYPPTTLKIRNRKRCCRERAGDDQCLQTLGCRYIQQQRSGCIRPLSFRPLFMLP